MEGISYVLIAEIGNLEHVTYKYTVAGTASEKTVTEKQATEFFGQNIKDCAKSAKLLDELLAKTRLK
ncbi:MAG: hypothetical protein IJ744_02535 [Lachnospiraceae bacterium]|nr:hypothetical protein [Lachnospiraceae bacterium]